MIFSLGQSIKISTVYIGVYSAPLAELRQEMAGISFLDLLFAEAIASGMAREVRTRERPPPDNFFLLPRDTRAWLQIKEASKKENMVIAVEVTDDSNENSQRLFLDLAREYDGMPFLRVKIGLGRTFDQVGMCLHVLRAMHFYVQDKLVGLSLVSPSLPFLFLLSLSPSLCLT